MLTCCFTAELKNLAEIRRFVADSAASLGIPPETTMDLVQAVDEAATNIMIHGYQNHSGEIEVNVERQDDFIVINMRDDAPVFDPTLFPSPNLNLPLEERKVGGLGIYLIRQSVDELRYRALPSGGNELTLVKRTAIKQP